MTDKEILDLAYKFIEKHINRYVIPGTLGKCEGSKVEVILLKKEALDPNVVIDPPDLRLWVNTETREVTKILQM